MCIRDRCNLLVDLEEGEKEQNMCTRGQKLREFPIKTKLAANNRKADLCTKNNYETILKQVHKGDSECSKTCERKEKTIRRSKSEDCGWFIRQKLINHNKRAKKGKVLTRASDVDCRSSGWNKGVNTQSRLRYLKNNAKEASTNNKVRLESFDIAKIYSLCAQVLSIWNCRRICVRAACGERRRDCLTEWVGLC
eukprot:TRINITY_DN7127_c0_g1_i1.p1 TRINITY_DN7127_c0_g1~~TRINITY_DN7127_c0_g1_i1.p1  ORF type:complete len:194 (-),score=1.57 TRINITY_DN7127_c0_g1_i1:268-849(-)